MAGLGGTSNPSPPRRRHHQATSRVSFGSETYTNVALLGGKGALLKANASRDVLATGRAQGTSIPSPPQRGTRPSTVSASSLNSLHRRGSKSVLRVANFSLAVEYQKKMEVLYTSVQACTWQSARLRSASGRNKIKLSPPHTAIPLYCPAPQCTAT